MTLAQSLTRQFKAAYTLYCDQNHIVDRGDYKTFVPWDREHNQGRFAAWALQAYPDKDNYIVNEEAAKWLNANFTLTRNLARNPVVLQEFRSVTENGEKVLKSVNEMTPEQLVETTDRKIRSISSDTSRALELSRFNSEGAVERALASADRLLDVLVKEYDAMGLDLRTMYIRLDASYGRLVASRQETPNTATVQEEEEPVVH